MFFRIKYGGCRNSVTLCLAGREGGASSIIYRRRMVVLFGCALGGLINMCFWLGGEMKGGDDSLNLKWKCLLDRLRMVGR